MANPNTLRQSTHSIESGKIEEFLSLKASQQALKERLQQVEAALGTAESEIMHAIDAGADSPIGYDLAITETARRYPAWKQHFIDHVGKAEADIVLQETAPTITRRLVVK